MKSSKKRGNQLLEKQKEYAVEEYQLKDGQKLKKPFILRKAL